MEDGGDERTGFPGDSQGGSRARRYDDVKAIKFNLQVSL
jgi:hypothetical protein